MRIKTKPGLPFARQWGGAIALAGLTIWFALPGRAAADDLPLIRIQAASGHLDVSAADIAQVEVLDELGFPTLSVRLAPAMDKAIADLTDRHIGQPVSIIICGEVVMRPIIRSPLPRAEFNITSPVPADVLRLAGRLRAPDCAAPLPG